MPATPAFEPFRIEDFRLYETRNRGDESLNGRRLEVRHKLQAIGEAAKVKLAADGIVLERRESLHHPFSINHMRVVAQWTSLFRDAKARKTFARMVGPELGKDVDPGNANVAFFVSIDEGCIQIGIRLGENAWYDARNWIQPCEKSDPQRTAFVEIVRRSPGFYLRIHDWEKTWSTEKFTRDDFAEIIKYYKIGEHRFTFTRRINKSDPASGDPALLANAVESLHSLAPIYRCIAWTPDNDRLFQSGGGFVHS
ncbi:MAG: hypothetical protein HY286_01985 [Planctomycetes bacterium]|nr:hypothetical protein [Planctomycetota bacterium]